MSRPRYRWWGFAKNMIRDFPTVEEAWNDIHSQSITANMSGMPRGGGSGRTVETVSLRQLPPEDQKLYDAVTLARAYTMLRSNGAHRMKLIRLTYWGEKRLLIKDAALLIPISYDTAKEWHGDFVELVGKCYGLE